MSLKKDKVKVLGETFDDERIRTFLNQQAPEGYDADFFTLERAYRGMLADNFETFIGFFLEAGGNINAENPQGETLTTLVSRHLKSAEYLDILTKAGGR